jgi:hypothetical protein
MDEESLKVNEASSAAFISKFPEMFTNIVSTLGNNPVTRKLF